MRTRPHNILPCLPQPLRKAGYICRLQDVPPYVTHRSTTSVEAQPPRRGQEGCGGWPWWRGHGFQPWGWRWWVPSGSMGTCGAVACGPQNVVSLQGNLSSPPCATRGGEPGWPAVCVPTDLEWLHRSQSSLGMRSTRREKHVKQKSYPREPGQTAVLQRLERYLLPKEFWIHLSARVNSRFCS